MQVYEPTKEQEEKAPNFTLAKYYWSKVVAKEWHKEAAPQYG
jgi:hypothetical protein